MREHGERWQRSREMNPHWPAAVGPINPWKIVIDHATTTHASSCDHSVMMEKMGQKCEEWPRIYMAKRLWRRGWEEGELRNSWSPKIRFSRPKNSVNEPPNPSKTLVKFILGSWKTFGWISRILKFRKIPQPWPPKGWKKPSFGIFELKILKIDPWVIRKT